MVAGIDRYAAAISPKPPTPLFILGLPRSGTTLVYELIIQIFKVAYLPKIFNYTFGLPNITARACKPFIQNPTAQYRSNYGRIPGVFSPAENNNFWTKWFVTTPSLGHHIPNTFIDYKARQQANLAVGSLTTIANQPYVFKNVYFSLAIDALAACFENAKIIVVRRNIKDVAGSIYKRRSALKSAKQWWSIKPPFYTEVQQWDLIEQIAFQCIRSEQLIERSLRNISSSRYFILNYKDLCNSPHDLALDLSKWLGPTYLKRTFDNIPNIFPYSNHYSFEKTNADKFYRCEDILKNSEEEYLAAIDNKIKQLELCL